MFKHKRVDIGAKKVGMDGAPNILRTIHMPSESNSQESETIKLNIQIETNRIKNEQVINRLRDEKCAFEEQQRAEYIVKKQKID